MLALVPIVAVWVSAGYSAGALLPRTPLNLSLYVLLVTVCFSALISTDIGHSLPKISGTLLGVILFWSLVRWGHVGNRLRLLIRFHMSIGAGLAVLGLLGTDWQGAKLAFLSTTADLLPKVIRGLPGAEEGFNPNAIAGGLLLFVPLQLAVTKMSIVQLVRISPKTPESIAQSMLCISSATACLLMLALSQSRGAWGGFALGIAVFLFLTKGKFFLRLAFALTLTMLIAGTTWLFMGHGEKSFQLVSSDLMLTIWGRVELWSRGLSALHDAPLTGMGMNGFRLLLPILYPTVLVSDLNVAHVHNMLLQVALDLGLIGLISYLALWVLTGQLLWEAVRRTTAREHGVIPAALLSGFLAHAVFGLTDAIALGTKIGASYWITLALAVVVYQKIEEDDGVTGSEIAVPPSRS